jgi:Spy/CpxP family protein refolding chaperone
MMFRSKMAKAALVALALSVVAPLAVSTAEAAQNNWQHQQQHHKYDNRHHVQQNWRNHHHVQPRHGHDRHHGMTNQAWRRFGN